MKTKLSSLLNIQISFSEWGHNESHWSLKWFMGKLYTSQSTYIFFYFITTFYILTTFKNITNFAISAFEWYLLFEIDLNLHALFKTLLIFCIPWILESKKPLNIQVNCRNLGKRFCVHHHLNELIQWNIQVTDTVTKRVKLLSGMSHQSTCSSSGWVLPIQLLSDVPGKEEDGENAWVPATNVGEN